jgi:hypothetical protein
MLKLATLKRRCVELKWDTVQSAGRRLKDAAKAMAFVGVEDMGK